MLFDNQVSDNPMIWWFDAYIKFWRFIRHFAKLLQFCSLESRGRSISWWRCIHCNISKGSCWVTNRVKGWVIIAMLWCQTEGWINNFIKFLFVYINVKSTDLNLDTPDFIRHQHSFNNRESTSFPPDSYLVPGWCHYVKNFCWKGYIWHQWNGKI